MPPHVASQGLPGRELSSTYRALMNLGNLNAVINVTVTVTGVSLSPQNTPARRDDLQGQSCARREQAPIVKRRRFAVGLGLLVARSVAAQSLKRGETPVARLALVNDVVGTAATAVNSHVLHNWLLLRMMMMIMALGEEDQAVGHVLFLFGGAARAGRMGVVRRRRGRDDAVLGGGGRRAWEV